MTASIMHSEWRSPSNIALIKYWGKKKGQIPRNPSISFTLSEAYTQTRINVKEQGQLIDLYIDGQKNEAFAERIRKLMNGWHKNFPSLSRFSMDIETHNSFPHSTGIASSASGMSALVLCLLDLEYKIRGNKNRADVAQTSHLARLASGSASRSVIPYVALWGKTTLLRESSDKYAIEVVDVDRRFYDYHDDVVIISSEKKAVSSSAGHALMDVNIYAKARYQQANKNLCDLLDVLKTYDLERFCGIVEQEAMVLHALMMCSSPSYVLMKPGTLEGINIIQGYRKRTHIPVCFTLDAGPNIHLLYPHEYESDIKRDLMPELLTVSESDKVIKDRVGKGPIKIS